MQPKLRRRNISINVDCTEQLVINSFPGSFYQIISNLVLNSLTHGYEESESGHIEIKLERDPKLVLLVYSADGKGMSADAVKHIFDPFFTTRRSSDGSGLGMHIVYNLVTQLLQGSITCQSKVGHGVRFSIQAPLDNEPLLLDRSD